MEIKTKRVMCIIMMAIFIIIFLTTIITPTEFYRAQWSYSNIVGANIINENSYINIPSSEEHPYLYLIYGKLINQMENYPGIQIFLSEITLLTGLDIITIYSFFPLGEILIILASILIANIFFKKQPQKKFMLILFSSIGLFGPSMLRIDFHVLQTSIMIFTFCLTLWAMYQNFTKDKMSYIWIIVFLLLLNRAIYFSSSIFYYTFLIIFSVLFILFSYLVKHHSQKKNMMLQATIYILLSIASFLTWLNLNIFTYILSQTKMLFFFGLIGGVIMLFLIYFLPRFDPKHLKNYVNIINEFIIKKIHYIFILFLILSPFIVFLIFRYYLMLESTLSNRFFSLLLVIPSFFILPFILRDYLKNENKIENVIYISSILSIFGLITFSFYMPYLITRGLIFLQIIFFVGLILFFSREEWINKKYMNYIFLVLVIFLILNNFTYLLSSDNNYGSSNDLRVKEGLYTFVNQIDEEQKISSDLKILSNSLVLGHENSYLPFISKSNIVDIEYLLEDIFYDNNPYTTYEILSNNDVDYFILSEEMFEYGIYIHDYQHDPLPEELLFLLEENEKFDKIYSNEGLFVFGLN